MGLISLLRTFFNRKSEVNGAIDEQVVRHRFTRDLRLNEKECRRRYWRQSPSVINTDTAKELCGEYTANRTRYSKCVYEPAKNFVDQLFAEEMESGRWKQVLLLAGGAASGKSMGVATWRAGNSLGAKDLGAFLTVDGTLSDFERASQYCELASYYGHLITVVYVYCPVEKALRWALDRAVRSGRTLPLSRFAQTHFGAQRTVVMLSDNPPFPDMDFSFQDNSRDVAETSTLENVLLNRYESFEDTLARTISAFEHECTRRKAEGDPLPEVIRKAFEG